jgi:RNA polymerase sigma-70 factor (sigma-E family)
METVQPRRERSAAPQVHDFDSWVAARGPALMGLALALTGNRPDAEDLVQEVLSRILPRWSRLCRMEDPDAYTKRMIVNAHISTWRRTGRRESPVAEPAFEGSTPGPDTGVFPDERRRLWVACQALPVPQRTAVVLRYYEQLEYAEIAEIMGVREATVRSRVSRAMASLRRELGEDHG